MGSVKWWPIPAPSLVPGGQRQSCERTTSLAHSRRPPTLARAHTSKALASPTLGPRPGPLKERFVTDLINVN
jgi:hypothetical protein